MIDIPRDYKATMTRQEELRERAKHLRRNEMMLSAELMECAADALDAKDRENVEAKSIAVEAQDEWGEAMNRYEGMKAFLEAQRDLAAQKYMDVSAQLSTATRERDEALAQAGVMREAILAVLPEMRREHGAGDGHFSTAQIAAIDAMLAASPAPPAAEGNDALVETAEPWVIRKHGAFYRPNRAGYTNHIEAAGIYTREEAEREAAIEPKNVSAHPMREFRGELQRNFDAAAAALAKIDATINTKPGEVA